MNNIYKVQRKWYISGGTSKFSNWTPLRSGFYRYISDDHAVHDENNSIIIFKTFDELYKAANEFSNIIIDKTPITKKRRITLNGYWYLGESCVLIEGKDENCFPIKTKLVSTLDEGCHKITELANLLSAEDFCQYLVDHGLGGLSNVDIK